MNSLLHMIRISIQIGSIKLLNKSVAYSNLLLASLLQEITALPWPTNGKESSALTSSRETTDSRTIKGSKTSYSSKDWWLKEQYFWRRIELRNRCLRDTQIKRITGSTKQLMLRNLHPPSRTHLSS